MIALAQPAPAPKPDPADAAFHDGVASVIGSLTPETLVAVEIVVPVAGPEGKRFRYSIYIRGEEAVAEAVKLLAAAKVERRGRAPADPREREKHEDGLDCRLVIERHVNVVDLEQKGELFLDLLAEDDGKPRAKPVAVGVSVRFDVAGPHLELLAPADPRVRGASLESEKLRQMLKSAVDGDAKRAMELWGEESPYGLARSSLAEGIAYASLGFAGQAKASLGRTAALCRKNGKWDYLAKDAEGRLKGLEARK